MNAPPTRLIVHFQGSEDPTREQSAAVYDLLQRFGLDARVVREMPGALQIEVRAETEQRLRAAVDSLPDWNVVSEGSAQMPSPPIKGIEK